MKTYVSILRGINVSGKNTIKMDDLRRIYEKLGFHKVTTYVQSGNVIFTGQSTDTDELSKAIEQQIKKEFGFDVPVIVMTVEQLKQIIENNPYVKDCARDKTFLHVTFLSSKPDESGFQAVEAKKMKGEEIIISGNAVYLYCPNGYGKSKLSNSLLETKLKVVATTRNWKTTNELLRIAQLAFPPV